MSRVSRQIAFLSDNIDIAVEYILLNRYVGGQSTEYSHAGLSGPVGALPGFANIKLKLFCFITIVLLNGSAQRRPVDRGETSTARQSPRRDEYDSDRRNQGSLPPASARCCAKMCSRPSPRQQTARFASYRRTYHSQRGWNDKFAVQHRHGIPADRIRRGVQRAGAIAAFATVTAVIGRFRPNGVRRKSAH